MDVKRLGVVQLKSRDVPFGIVAEMEDERHIIVAEGFYTEESATLNIGAILGRYRDLFLHDDEYPVETMQKPGPYSLRGTSVLWNDRAIIKYRMHWINADEYDILYWFDYKSVLIK